MKMKKLLTTILAGGFLVATVTANAAVVIISNNSYIETSSEAWDASSSDVSGDFDAYPDTIIPSSFYGEIGSFASVTDAWTEESAFMDVSITDAFSPMSISMDMSVYANAETSSSDGEAYGYADSILDITFETDELYEFFFGAEFIFASGYADVEILLTNSSGDTLMDIFIVEDFVSPFESVLASADEYYLTVTMMAGADVIGGPDGNGGDASGQMFFDVAPVVVPVPAAVWLFGFGLIGLVGVARRKH